MDTVEKLTIYVDKKNDLGQFENIVIKDTYNKKTLELYMQKLVFFTT